MYPCPKNVAINLAPILQRSRNSQPGPATTTATTAASTTTTPSTSSTSTTTTTTTTTSDRYAETSSLFEGLLFCLKTKDDDESTEKLTQISGLGGKCTKRISNKVDFVVTNTCNSNDYELWHTKYGSTFSLCVVCVCVRVT